MEKTIRRFEIDYSFNWVYGIDIKRLREDLENIEELGATHIEIEHGMNYDCSYAEVRAYADRLETDEEARDRVEEESRRRKEIERRELEQFEKLKSKYGQ